MDKARGLEVPPPGAGLNTRMEAVPGTAMSLAGMAACNSVLLTKVVVRLLSFQRTTEPELKSKPNTERRKPAPPGAILLGESEVNLGKGLRVGSTNSNAPISTTAEPVWCPSKTLGTPAKSARERLGAVLLPASIAGEADWRRYYRFGRPA